MTTQHNELISRLRVTLRVPQNVFELINEAADALEALRAEGENLVCDAERQERDVTTAKSIFANNRLGGENSALNAAIGYLWPNAFSHGFQTAKQQQSIELRRSYTRNEAMNNTVLKELAVKWLRDAKPLEVSDGSEDVKLGNALAKGVRIGLERCAGDLLSIIKLLGDES